MPTIVNFDNDISLTALLHFNGNDASITMLDQMGNYWAANGDAQLDTAQSKFGSASLLLDGTGDYVQGTDSAAFDFGTGDYTIDFWIRLNATGIQQALYTAGASTNVCPIIYISSSDKIVFALNSADRITGGTSVTTGQWYHIALARSGTDTKLFLDGTQEGSTYSGDSANYDNQANCPLLGRLKFPSTSYFNGWMDELRVIKGTALFTANFTAPTAEYS